MNQEAQSHTQGVRTNVNGCKLFCSRTLTSMSLLLKFLTLDPKHKEDT